MVAPAVRALSDEEKALMKAMNWDELMKRCASA
jgi:hypothetical protein